MARTRRRASSSRVSGVALVELVDHPLVEDVDRELAGDLAGRRAAHPVAHREERPVRADDAGAVGLEQPARLARQVGDEEVVLVVLADLPHVGPREELHADLAPGSGRSVLRVAAGCGDAVGGVGLRHVSNRKSCWPMRK